MEVPVALGTRALLLPDVGRIVSGEVFGPNENGSAIIAGIILWTL